MKFNSPFWTRRPHLVLPLALGALFIPLILIIGKVIRATGGSFMYPLDDPFIHMTIAKTLAFQGNWGIAGHEFESASSSVLYTLLLAALFRLFSVHMLIPLIINILSGIGLIVVIDRWLQKQLVSSGGRLFILLAVIFFTPLPITILSGMEHTLQCLFSFLFLCCFSDRMAGEGGAEKGGNLPMKLYLYGILTCAIRYEGLFMIAIACGILLYKRRIRAAFGLGILSFLPLLIFGIYSIQKGSYFLPNSVLLKSDGLRLSLSGLVHFIYEVLFVKLNVSSSGITTAAVQRLLLLLPLVYLFFVRRVSQVSNYAYALIILFVCVVLQLSVAAVGWFYRYEAWLILNAVVIVSVLLYKNREQFVYTFRSNPVISVVLLFFLTLPFFLRSTEAFRIASRACINIYDQQYQMGQFFHRYYNNTVVAANDIGVISYYKQEKNLDLFGLASIKVAKSKKNNYCTPGFLDSLSRSEDVKVAVLYQSWFSPLLLDRWNKTASWSIPNNVICGDSVVTFYTIDKKDGEVLKEKLREYQSSLPAAVQVRYFSNEEK